MLLPPPAPDPTDSPQVAELKRQLRLAHLKIQVLEEKLRLLRLRKYGPAAERLSSAQLSLLELEPGVSQAEVEAEAQREPLPEPAPTPARKPARPHPGRQELPAELPRRERVPACPPDELHCPDCGAPRAW